MKRQQDTFKGQRTTPLQHRIQKPGMVVPNKTQPFDPAPPVPVSWAIETEEGGDLVATDEGVDSLVLQEEAP